VDAERILDDLFARARDADEFEYASALLRVRGMEDFGWDPLEETTALFNDLASLLEAPLNDYARLRLGLLLYSHLTEVDAMYEMLANLVEITGGERYTMDPFRDLCGPANRRRYAQNPPSAKRVVERLKDRSAARGSEELVELLDWFFNDAVRNAFFHSDYILYRDEFRSREATFIDADGRRSSTLKIDGVVDLINRAIAVFQAFISVYERHRGSYREDKQIRGRLGATGEEIDVTLLASEERGLYGFRA